MNADSLNQLFEDPAPHSSIRKAIHRETDATRSNEPSPSSILTLSPGVVLASKYRIERKLGEGAMGVVFAATHLGLDETVAIKLMRHDVQQTDGTFARFAKEAKIAARIRSEHVPKVLDVDVLDGLGPFIVMEYLEGSSLADMLEASGPFRAERVIAYVLQACEALAAAHSIGVVHRDVKPDNLFVTRHGDLEVLKLLDFGISKARLEGSVLGEDMGASTVSFVMGTPLYMSPEQLRTSADVDVRTDVWSLGVAIYELVCGRPPFTGESIAEICAAILDAAPAPLPDTCPAALRAVVSRCLEKDRSRRYQNIAELAAALVPLAPGEAQAYASRSSCILRASTLNLKLEPAVNAPAPQTAAAPHRVRSSRFQSSALVAATTVLALAALGVASTVSRGSEPHAESGVVAPSPTPLPVPAASPPAVEPAIALPAVLESLDPGMSPAASIDATGAAVVQDARSPGFSPLVVTREAPAAETPGVAAPRSRVSTPKRSKPADRRRRIEREQPANSTGGPTAGVSSRPEPPSSRVRLVEPRPKLRLVDPAEREAASARGN
jgi:serine/threonine-protein kinase